MPKRLKVYLDTSVISALFDKRNPDRNKITERFFERASDFEVFISDVALDEIADAQSTRLRENMIGAVRHFAVLPLSDEGVSLGKEYVSNGAVPTDCLRDAYHIAIAVLNDIGHLVSWNFQHIVRWKTRRIVGTVNRSKRLPQIIILTPREL